MKVKKKEVNTLELYDPHEMQLKFHESPARFRVVSFGRQSGKSTACLNELLLAAWTQPSSVNWFISPIYAQAKIQFRRLVDSIGSTSEIFKRRPNESELKITLINNSTIFFKSGESFDNLRSETLNNCVIDEVRDQHPDLWPLVVRPMLSTTKGKCSFVSTPRGFDAFYDLFHKAETDTTGLWACFNAPSTCNPLFTQDEYDMAKADMSEAQFAQEILAEFRDLTSGKAYATFSTNNISEKSFFSDTEYTPHLPIVLMVDFNINPMAWCLGQFNNNRGFIFKELFILNTHTQEAALHLVKVLKEYNNKYPLKIIGDASGKARQRAASNQSDYDIIHKVLHDHNIIFENITPDSNPSIRDRVNTVSSRLCSASGEISVKMHPSCKMLIKDLQRVVWKSGEGVTLDPGKEKMLTHMSDAFGYGVYKLMPIHELEDVGKLRIIKRY